MTWHIDQELADSYQAGVVSRPGAASVEAHLTSCRDCRALLDVDERWLEESWLGVADRVEPRTNRLEGLLRRVGVPEVAARLTSVSPAVRVSFLLSLVLVLAFAVVASNSDVTNAGYRVFLMVAPLIPVVGVAFAYGRLVDPAFELTAASPINSLRVLLIRSATVTTFAILLGLATWPFVPAPASVGMSAWLLPSLGLTLSTLALASRFEMWVSALMIVGGWMLAGLLSVSVSLEIYGSVAHVAYVCLAAVAAGLIVMRRHEYDRRGGGR